MLAREVGCLVERSVQLDVRIQIDDVAHTGRQQMPEKRRLDRGRELRDVVDRNQRADLVAIETDLLRRGIERFPAPIDVTRLVVDQKDREAPAGMVLEK